MPVPPVTALDEPWPFFLFWRHHFWPKLASSILNFCRRKRSFQWYSDQSDRPNGTLDMHKNAQKVEWKTQSKISCHYTWLLHAKNFTSRWRFLWSFLEKEKRERRKKNSKNRKALRRRSLSRQNFGFFFMSESQCTKTQCWWQERQAAVLQTHCPPDER